MAGGSEGRTRVRELEREVARLGRTVRELERRLALAEERARRSARGSASRDRRERIVLGALGLGPRPRAGDSGKVGRLQGSVVRLQEYLLRTGERIDAILTALKEHREFLADLDKRLLHSGTRERIRIELDVMTNTLSILAIAGVEVDDALVKEIEKLRSAARKEDGDVAALRKEKQALDRRYEEELKRFDLDAIWSKRREIPGYR